MNWPARPMLSLREAGSWYSPGYAARWVRARSSRSRSALVEREPACPCSQSRYVVHCTASAGKKYARYAAMTVTPRRYAEGLSGGYLGAGAWVRRASVEGACGKTTASTEATFLRSARILNAAALTVGSLRPLGGGG